MSNYLGSSEIVKLTVLSINGILVALSCVQIGALLKFVILDETLLVNLKLTRKTVATPFNLLLLIMALSNACVYISFSFEVYAVSDQSYRLAKCFNEVGALPSQLAYITYIWLRGEPVVDIFIPAAVPYLRVALKLFAFLFVATTMPILLTFCGLPETDLLTLAKYFQICCGLCTVAFDLFIGIVFLRYLKSIGNNENSVGIVDRKLQIVARFGVASTTVGLTGVGLFSLCTAVRNANLAVILLQLVFSCFSVIWMILLFMKRALHFLKLSARLPTNSNEEKSDNKTRRNTTITN